MRNKRNIAILSICLIIAGLYVISGKNTGEPKKVTAYYERLKSEPAVNAEVTHMIEVLRNIIVFLRVMSFRIKSLSEEEFKTLLSNCTYEQVWYAIWLRYYM